MKKTNIGALLALTFALMLPAFAADTAKTTKSVNIPSNSVVQGKALPAGNYKVEYVVQGQNAQVNFLKGKTTVAQVPATVVSQNSPEGTALVTHNANGSTVLDQIEFAHQTLDFGQQAGSQPGQ